MANPTRIITITVSRNEQYAILSALEMQIKEANEQEEFAITKKDMTLAAHWSAAAARTQALFAKVLNSPQGWTK